MHRNKEKGAPLVTPCSWPIGSLKHILTMNAFKKRHAREGTESYVPVREYLQEAQWRTP